VGSPRNHWRPVPAHGWWDFRPAPSRGAADVTTPPFPLQVPIDPAPDNLVAVGIDLTSVCQIRHSLRDFGDDFLHRVFTPAEIVDCSASHDPAPHLAARFAAKEATIKALMVEDLQPPWTSIEVRRHPSGSCAIHLTGEAARLAGARGIGRLVVSLTHEGDLAAAVVVATTRD